MKILSPFSRKEDSYFFYDAWFPNASLHVSARIWDKFLPLYDENWEKTGHVVNLYKAKKTVLSLRTLCP